MRFHWGQGRTQSGVAAAEGCESEMSGSLMGLSMCSSQASELPCPLGSSAVPIKCTSTVLLLVEHQGKEFHQPD